MGKLISNPSDYPRAYICDECIAVCQAIIEDDAGVPNALDLDEILRRPQMVELIGALNCWVDRETRGENAEEELGEVRRLTMQILPYRAADSKARKRSFDEEIGGEKENGPGLRD